jgi:DNA-binding response OmpR family regulator
MTADPFEQAPRVVLIDADPSRRRGLGQGLRRRGVELHCAATAREAIELASSIRPDVLVLGEALADAGGLALLRAVRREGALGVVPVIVLAPGDDAAARLQALRACASVVVAAPCDAG